jgi:hypothetical protein
MIGYWPLGLVLLESGAPKFLWSEVVNIATYLVNKPSTMANQKKSRMEIFLSKNQRQVFFASLVVKLIYMYYKKTRKLEAKFIKALVGYHEQTKAYMLLKWYN